MIVVIVVIVVNDNRDCPDCRNCCEKSEECSEKPFNLDDSSAVFDLVDTSQKCKNRKKS